MKNKLLRISSYLGFAPQLYLFNSKEKEDVVIQQHIQKGLNLYMLLFLSILFLATVQAIEILLGYSFPNISLKNLFIIVLFMDILSGTPLAIWVIFWLLSVFHINHDAYAPSGFLGKFGNLKVSKFYLVACGILLQVGLFFMFFAIIRANYLANHSNENASVYLLYETYDPIPRWVYATGFYPIAEIANIRWGEGSVAVEPLTRENINRALQNGRLVVLASHGGYPNGTITIGLDSNENYSPNDVYQISGVGPNLQFVYISGCYTGSLHNEWEQALSPAKVMTFDRISWATEHALWLWTGGVKVVLEIK